MNKIIGVLLSISVFCMFSTAQNSKLDFGVELGVNYCSSSEKTDPLEKKNPLLPRVGFVAKYDVSNSFFLQSGVFYNFKGVRSEGEGLKGDARIEAEVVLNQHIMQIPIYAGYQFDFAKSQLSFGVGPYIAYGFSGKTKADGKMNGVDVHIEKNTFNDILKPFDSGLNLKLSYEISRFTLSCSYEFSLLDIGNKNVLGADIDYKNRIAAFTVGYNFFSRK